jgi:hypothetical protein
MRFLEGYRDVTSALKGGRQVWQAMDASNLFHCVSVWWWKLQQEIHAPRIDGEVSMNTCTKSRNRVIAGMVHIQFTIQRRVLQVNLEHTASAPRGNPRSTVIYIMGLSDRSRVVSHGQRDVRRLIQNLYSELLLYLLLDSTTVSNCRHLVAGHHGA